MNAAIATAPTQWADVQSRATTPGSPILTAWRAERQAARAGVRNDVTDSALVISGDSRALDMFAAGPAAAGLSVTPDSAMRVSAVFACVQRIAGAIATLPIHVYERTKDGRQRAEGAPLWFLLNEEPTARFSAASHWEGVSIKQLLRGDAHTFISRNKMGDVKELVPLPWDAVVPRRRTTDGKDRLAYDVQDVRTWGVDQDDMLHFPGFGFNGLRSMSVIQWAARNATGNAQAMDEYSGKFFANGSHPSVILESPNKMTPERIDQLQQAYVGKYSGVSNAHRIPLVLTEGLKATPISISSDDSQLLDARKFQVIDIARAFGVPPHMIGETSASTSWGSGIESMSRGFVTFTLQNHLVRIEQELNRKLFRSGRYFVEFNRDALLEGDSKGQADYFRAAIGGPGSGPGWMSVDDVRKLKNLPPQGGRGAEIYYPPEKPANTKEPQGNAP